MESEKMEKCMQLKNCYMMADDEAFKVICGDMHFTICFDRIYGISVTSIKNTGCEREVEYLTAPSTLMPILIKCDETNEGIQNGEFEELVNAASEKGNGPKKRHMSTITGWQMCSYEISKELYGGVNTLKLTIEMRDNRAFVVFNLVAFPDTSIIRYNFDIKNISNEANVYSLIPFDMTFTIDTIDDVIRANYFGGGDRHYDFGRGYEKYFGSHSRPLELKSESTGTYVPIVVLSREHSPNDAIMVEMDYFANWSLNIEREDQHVNTMFSIENPDIVVESKESICVPTITMAFYSGDMDDLMVKIYDWQYTYMWDYTLNDYYAKLRTYSSDHPWVYCSRILNEQFCYRLIGMDMLSLKLLSYTGMEMLWDDAGWSAYPGWPENKYRSVFKNNFEGPDHRLSTKYINKYGLKRLLWFAGKPSPGLLSTKHGAWGEFERRTDNCGSSTFREEEKFRKEMIEYVSENSTRSFHTCWGGSRYAHTFDVHRYSNFHYAADNSIGPIMNYYLSYFEPADRIGDLLPSIGGENYDKDGSHHSAGKRNGNLIYNKEFARAGLGLCGMFGPLTHENQEYIKEDVEIYRYFKENGIAGRWSYMFHPGVYGDKEIYYLQRTSHDRKKACIIMRHCPQGRVVIYPKGLNENDSYTVSFEISDVRFVKTGKELMEEGMVIRDCKERELIYFNLPDSPKKAKSDKCPRIKKVVCRVENNIGVRGFGIYWSSEGRQRHYEILRNGEVIGKVAWSRYFFDHETDINDMPTYSVRAVGVEDKVSAEVIAIPVTNGNAEFALIGFHGSNLADMGWRAETSKDLKHFQSMKWVAPIDNPGADTLGTPNQEGGIEGYFEGGKTAKVGRGWQQASPDVYCVKSFVCPYDGDITLSVRALKEFYHNEFGCDQRICIMHNDRRILDWYELNRGDREGLSYTDKFTVVKGDIIRFVVDKCDDTLNEKLHYEQNANIVVCGAVVTYDGQEDITAMPAIRINCGGPDYTDSSDAVWKKDCFFTEGEAYGENSLYESSRRGNKVHYEIPVSDGIYAVRLCFKETEYKEANERFMRVNINGFDFEKEMDIVHDARGADKVYTKVYRYIVPDENGNIAIDILSLKGGADICAIEITAESDEFVRINCGGGDYVDWLGYVWKRDEYFDSGDVVYNNCPELRQANPTLYDKSLYYSGRSGMEINYTIPVMESVKSVHLKFAELEVDIPGKRPCDIYINNVKVKKDFDPLETSGEKPMSSDLRFDDISSINGEIKISLVAKKDLPVVLRAISLD